MTETIIVSSTLVAALLLVLAILRLRHVSVQGLMFGLSGTIVGLLLGALASVPLSKLPDPAGGIMPVVISSLLTIVMMVIFLTRRAAIIAALPFLHGKPAKPAPAAAEATEASAATVQLPQILVDTSVIIDGRIADIATAGFVPGRLAVPRFVLAELQNIADSDDAMRRGRGRRGLDVLNTLRELPDVQVDIIEDDVPNVREVDAKLVALAQRFSCNVLTTDYNLNRVAQIQGVRVLNVNELSNAIRPVVLPGEELLVRVVQPGKERNQGVGYLADGTMIVVENGDKLIGQQVSTEVTRVFQTVAGKMIFAVPRGSDTSGQPAQPQNQAQASVAPAPQGNGQVAGMGAMPPVRNEEPNGRRNRSGRNRGSNGKHGHNDKPAAGDSVEDRIVTATRDSRND